MLPHSWAEEVGASGKSEPAVEEVVDQGEVGRKVAVGREVVEREAANPTCPEVEVDDRNLFDVSLFSSACPLLPSGRSDAQTP